MDVPHDWFDWVVSGYDNDQAPEVKAADGGYAHQLEVVPGLELPQFTPEQAPQKEEYYPNPDTDYWDHLDPSLHVMGNAPELQENQQNLDIAVPQEDIQAVPVHLKSQEWTYCVDVWPAEDQPGESSVLDHIVAVQDSLSKNNVQYDLNICVDATDPFTCFRRYILRRKLRNEERARLNFLQVFSANKPYNAALKGYRFTMSVVGYEPRQFIHNDAYPSMGDPEHDGGGQVRYNDHDVAVSVSELSAYNPPVPKLIPSPEPHHGLEISTPTAQPQPPTLTPAPALPATPKEDAEPRTPSRIKAIEKPVREPVKGLNGKFVCDWPNCTEESREFNRRCEWTKHMDKHDRPYRCLVEGCEKLPGFTYSGGLLRHEREVHHKHGGPKNPLNCPHPNCKRHTGKGFSRLENLNEHLRRVHTNNLDGVVSPLAAPDDSLAMVANEKVVVGTKRKAEDHDLQAEVKRLRAENERLEIQNKAQRQQQSAMMDQIASLQSELRAYRDPHLPGVPPVQMLEDNLHHF